MKKLIYILSLFLVFGVSSCFEDDSSLGKIEVSDIEIGDLKDTSMVSYNGNVLHLSPEVKTDYPEGEMSYAWYLVKGDETKGYRTNCIAEVKDLAYEINLPSGVYTLVFEVRSAVNSYTRTATLKLTVSTPFSQGFYILKETADGNTEVDLLTQDGLVKDLMTSLLENPLQGKPVNLSVVYDNGYIDDETLEMSSANMLHVFTERDYHGFRTEDMRQIFDRENIMFEPVSLDEAFCTMIQTSAITCLTNKGLYTSGVGASSGRLGVAELEGGSKYIQSFLAGMAGDVFWDGETHTLCSTVAGGPMEYELPVGFETASLECIGCGLNYMSGTDEGWFLCRDRNSGKSLLFCLKSIELAFWQYDLELEVRVVVPGSHLAKGDIVAGNGLDAKVIYVVDNGQLYLYSLDSETETPITLQGLEGEISYISNNYLNLCDYFGQPQEGNFNYLIIATRNGTGYNLYFYDNLVGGVPKGTAKTIIKGDTEDTTGEVRAVRYLSTTLTSGELVNNVFSYNGPVFPYGD